MRKVRQKPARNMPVFDMVRINLYLAFNPHAPLFHFMWHGGRLPGIWHGQGFI